MEKCSRSLNQISGAVSCDLALPFCSSAGLVFMAFPCCLFSGGATLGVFLVQTPLAGLLRLFFVPL